MRLKALYRVAKPGIVYGNLITVVAGYLLASGLKVHATSLAAAVFGIAMVIASACVANNLADRDIDSIMERTNKRPSVSGEISVGAGVIYALVLAAIGFSILALFTSQWCVVIGLVGYVDYALLYTYFKRKTYHATLIGSISGAVPIIGGYAAYSGHLTPAAWIIGAMMLVWQMPHFYSIALFRAKDYRRAGIPVMPAVLGRKTTGVWMVFYAALFLAAALLLYFYGPVGLAYLSVMGAVALAWLVFNIRGLVSGLADQWAKQNFRYSLIVMLVMSAAIALH